MKIVKLIDKYLLLILFFVYPLFFLSFYSNSPETSRLLLLSLFTATILIVKLIKTFFQKGIKMNLSALDLFILGIASIYILLGIFASPSKMDAFFLPGTSSFIFLGAIIYFFANQLDNKDKDDVSKVIVLSSTIFSILQILAFTGLIKNNYANFGNLINSFSYTIVTLSISVFEIIKNKNVIYKIFFNITSLIIFISAFTNLYAILPGKVTSPLLPNIKVSWSVAVDSLKERPLIGVGPTNFVSSYDRFRPVISNSYANWNSRFLVGSNTFLTVTAEVGIIGILLFLSIFIFSLKNILELNPYNAAILIAFIISFLYPYSPAFFPIIFLLFALNNKTKEVGGTFNSNIPLVVMTIPLFLLIFASMYYVYKAFYAEYLFEQTARYISQNEAIKTYDSINKTVNANPFVDRYHLQSAEINIRLAQSLSTKKDITEEDKKTLTQLIQQSIQEAKAAISINPNKSTSWENMGDIYVNISPFIKDVDKFAIQSYGQAIFLNPINPILRIKLGGIYLAQGNYKDAIKIFELAVLAKPDFANSHFNLAMAYKGDNQIDKAKEQMNLVLKLVDANTNDYQTAISELKKLEDMPKTAE